MKPGATLFSIGILLGATSVGAFSPGFPRHDHCRVLPGVRAQQTLLKDQPNEDEKPQLSQEAMMEEIAKKGAARVAKMDIPERAKRAMLAESLEDSIFQYEIELEEIIGESGIIPTDPVLLEKCKSIALQIKGAQNQYETLVSGLPSALLDTLDNIGSD